MIEMIKDQERTNKMLIKLIREMERAATEPDKGANLRNVMEEVESLII